MYIPISADYLEQRVIEILRAAMGHPNEINNLIRILRDQAEEIQVGAVERLTALIQKEREISSKLDNAIDAVLNGLNSPAIQDRIRQLETDKATVQRDMHALKAAVDASAIPEQRLREILDMVIASDGPESRALLSIVYRVEVYEDSLTIWTLLDTDPNGFIDLEQDGLTITPGIPSGVPIVIVTDRFIRITAAR